MQPPGGVDDDDVGLARFGRCNRIEHDGGRVAALRLLNQIAVRAVRPDLQLLDGRGAERVRRPEDDALVQRLQIGGELADRRGLADAVDADDEDHRGARAHAQLFPAGKHPGHGFAQKVKDFLRVLDLALLDLFAQLLADALGRRDADIPHDQKLFELFKQLVVNLCRGVEHLMDRIAHAFAGLF